MSNTYGEWYKHPFPLRATHLLQVEGERGAEMPAVLQSHAAWRDGFPHTRIISPKTKELGKQPHELVRNKNQPCQLGLGLLFTSTVGAWQLQLKANPLAWAKLCTLPSGASRAGPALVFTCSFPVLQRRLLAAAGMQQAPREAAAAARQGRATPHLSSGRT